VASYQIPQFLDSGDKIIGSLNIRQFAYALGGFLLCALIFSLVGSAVPGIGTYAAIPCIPVGGLFLYLALGKYNGRDSEIYVLKFILFQNKPKRMVYRRVPQLDDLNEKLSDWTEDKINKRWNDEVAKLKALDDDEYLAFGQGGAAKKAKQIRTFGRNLDMSTSSTMSKVAQSQIKIGIIEAQEAAIRQAQQSQLNKPRK
jgi:hypothetical protein